MRRWGIVLLSMFFREMPVGVRHQTRFEELAPERLSEIHMCVRVPVVRQGKACGE